MWVELQELQPGDLVQLRGDVFQVVTATLVEDQGKVVITGDNEAGKTLVYVGYADEEVKKALEMALHDVEVLA